MAADYYPGLLLLHAREKRGTSGLDEDELRRLAADHWPTRSAEWVDQVVERAIEERDRGVRRIDPATVDMRHPSERERPMVVTKNKLRDWLQEQIESDPDISNDDLEARAKDQLGPVSRRRLGAIAGMVRRDLDEPSTNGDQPPKPSAGTAEPDPPPATDPVEGAGQEEAKSGRIPVRRKLETPAAEKDPPEVGLRSHERTEYSERRTVDRRIGPPPNRVYVDVDPETQRAHLSVDIRELPAAVAWKIAAQVQLALAQEVA